MRQTISTIFQCDSTRIVEIQTLANEIDKISLAEEIAAIEPRVDSEQIKQELRAALDSGDILRRCDSDTLENVGFFIINCVKSGKHDASALWASLLLIGQLNESRLPMFVDWASICIGAYLSDAPVQIVRRLLPVVICIRRQMQVEYVEYLDELIESYMCGILDGHFARFVLGADSLLDMPPHPNDMDVVSFYSRCREHGRQVAAML